MSTFNERDPWKDKTIYQVPQQAPGLESGVSTGRYTSYTASGSEKKPNLPQNQPKQNTPTNQQTQNPSTVSSTGGGNGQYVDQLNSLYNQIMNRGQFKYDLNGDMLYRQMADQYTQLGRQAMMDTMGQAALLTGGYGNSYGTTAGNQAYQQYLTALNNNIPDLYNQALASWQAQGDELLNKYQMAAQHQATLDAMEPKTNTVYVTKNADTQENNNAVDPSYLAAVNAFVNGQPTSTLRALNNLIDNNVLNPLSGFYEKNAASMNTGGTNKSAAPEKVSVSPKLPIYRMDIDILKNKYRNK